MNIDPVVLGSMISVGGIIGHTQTMQRTNRLLTPEQLSAMLAAYERPWWNLLLPAVPILIGMALLPRFPNHQAYIGFPALALAIGLVVEEFFFTTARRTQSLNLPPAFQAARRWANAMLLIGLIVGMGVIAWKQLM